jgi:hypothetical protein
MEPFSRLVGLVSRSCRFGGPRASRSRAAGRAASSAPLAAAILAAALCLVGSGTAARAGSANPSFGPIPYNGTEQSRCEGLSVSSHIVFSGDKVTGTASAGICGGPPDNHWGWGVNQIVGSSKHGCGENGTFCEYKVGAATNAYGLICINGANVQGPWESCDYYAVVSKDASVIEGYVKDEDGSPVAGVTVDAKGKGGASTTTGPDGYYAMQVQPGSYQIVPSGGPHGRSAPRYRPAVNSTSIAAGTTGRADFTLQDGIKLELHFDKSAVPADGIQVVDGTITTTLDGAPVSAAVQLQGMPGVSPIKAVTAGPLAAVCSGGSRVWPTGTLSSPVGSYVTVNTDATGHYALAITVGTTPGVWSLNAWAKNTSGTLSTDAAAHDTQSITFDKLAGPATPLAAFGNDFNTAAKTAATGLELISSNASPMVATLAQTDAKMSIQTNMGALAFALVNGRDGQSVLVFQADRPPVINASGVVVPSKNAGDLVLDPAEWAGTTPLQTVLDKGALMQIPTISEFVAGKAVPGWKTVSGNEITLFSPSFEYLGWGYLGIGAPGACY